MIKTGLPRKAAEEMVAEGGRILKHYRDADGNPICDVEQGEAEPSVRAPKDYPDGGAEAKDQDAKRGDEKKKRSRPPKSASKG